MFANLFLNTHGALYFMVESFKWSQMDQVIHNLSIKLSNKIALCHHVTYFSKNCGLYLKECQKWKELIENIKMAKYEAPDFKEWSLRISWWESSDTIRAGKKFEIHLPSGPVNFSFHLPPLQYYLPRWWPVWKSKDKREQSMLGFLTNPCFQPNGWLIFQS